MEEKTSHQDAKGTSVIRIEEPSLEQTQLAEQLYNSAGLDPVVDAGLKDYDKRLQQENKLISKVLGPRGSDIRGYGEAVARRVAFAVYALLNKQYGGRVGDLRSYIMTLQEERDRSNTKYDELMGRVVGILGDEYKELRTDSKAFMERLTSVLGKDIKESKIGYQALVKRLADIDGLRSQIKTLEKEKAQLKERYESQITALTNQHSKEMEKLRSQIAERDSKIAALDSQLTDLSEEKKRLTQGYESQIAERDSKIGALDSEKAVLSRELKGLKTNYERLRTAIKTLPSAVPYEEIRKKLGEEYQIW